MSSFPSSVIWVAALGQWVGYSEGVETPFPEGFNMSILPTPRFAPGDLVVNKDRFYDTKIARIDRISLYLPGGDLTPGKTPTEFIQDFFDRRNALSEKNRGVPYPPKKLITYIARMNGHLKHLRSDDIEGLYQKPISDEQREVNEHLKACKDCASMKDAWDTCSKAKALERKAVYNKKSIEFTDPD